MRATETEWLQARESRRPSKICSCRQAEAPWKPQGLQYLHLRGVSRGLIGAIAHPKTYESNFIHHNFVQFGKQHSRYKAILCSLLFCHNSFVKYTPSLYVLCNVFTPTRKTLDFKHAPQKREKHKYTKEDEDIYIAVV